MNCKEEWHKEDCGQLDNSKYQNYGCKDTNSESYEYFECLNRMDKANILFDFNSPPVPANKTRNARNYNQILDFDENYIYCQQRIISYEEFADNKKWNASEKCYLKDGRTVDLQTLWIDLLTDFSFKHTSKIGEL